MYANSPFEGFLCIQCHTSHRSFYLVKENFKCLKEDSTYRHVLSTAVLKLQETGKLRDLKRKWWKEKRGGGLCTSDDASADAAELGVANLGGVFFVLVIGSLAGLLVGVAEMLMDVINISFRNKTSFNDELKEEVKFLLQLKQRSKRLRNSRTRSQSKDDSFEGFEFPPEKYSNYAPQITKQPVH